MSSDQFVFWLQGFIEIENPVSLDERQTQIIKDHLKLVFEKQSPERNVVLPHTGTASHIFPPNTLIC